MNASSSPDETWPEICADARVYLRSLTALPGIANSANQFELIAVAAGQETRTRLNRANLVDGAGRTGRAPQQRILALLARIEAARSTVCDLGMDRPRIMGVLNVTPDSFSDGGKNFDCGTAIAAAINDTENLPGEVADLLYHILVLLAAAGIQPEAVYEKLRERRK